MKTARFVVSSYYIQIPNSDWGWLLDVKHQMSYGNGVTPDGISPNTIGYIFNLLSGRFRSPLWPLDPYLHENS
jgi:hypothetical protein